MIQDTDNFFQKMYSKAGRASTQIFAHLLGKAQKFEKQKRQSDLITSLQVTPQQSPKKQQQPFTLCLSREYLQKQQTAYKQNLNIGSYNPKYQAIQKQQQVIQRKCDQGVKFSPEKRNSKRVSDPQIQQETNNNQSLFVPQKKIKGFIELKRQLSREKSTSQFTISQQQTSNQFISIDTSSIRVRPKSATFKGSGHSLNINKFNCFQSFYDVDYNVGRRRISFAGTAFKKQTQRKSNMNKSVCLREESIYFHDQFSQKNSIIHPNSKKAMIDFKKIIGRDTKPESSINRISKTNRSRMILDNINQKSIELNATAY